MRCKDTVSSFQCTDSILVTKCHGKELPAGSGPGVRQLGSWKNPCAESATMFLGTQERRVKRETHSVPGQEESIEQMPQILPGRLRMGCTSVKP